jgi:hypothetical protein
MLILDGEMRCSAACSVIAQAWAAARNRQVHSSASWRLQGSRRSPRWQFLGDELLPGLDVIVPAIPPGTTPAVLDVFMHSPQPDFDDRTPIEHLAAGGDPALVAGFIADLGRW